MLPRGLSHYIVYKLYMVSECRGRRYLCNINAIPTYVYAYRHTQTRIIKYLNKIVIQLNVEFVKKLNIFRGGRPPHSLVAPLIIYVQVKIYIYNSYILFSNISSHLASRLHIPLHGTGIIGRILDSLGRCHARERLFVGDTGFAQV